MRQLLQCRRGTAAFATVVALVPLIGAVALGGEASSWYVVKQHAQNAADAAATSGALNLACTLAGSSCADKQLPAYRGKQFAAQNGFCNPNDAAYPGATCAATLPAGSSQSVAIDVGTYTAGTWTTTASGVYVRATVRQQQPAYLASVLGLSTVNIAAQAIAKVSNPSSICGLGLSTGTALTIGGSAQLGGNGCGLMSNGAAKFNSSVSATGSGWGAFSANGCSPSSTCGNPGLPYNYYMPAAINPLSYLDKEAFNTSSGKTTNLCPGGGTCTLSPNTPTTLYGNLTVTTGNVVTFNPGTYFFYNAAVKINGGSVTGANVNIVLLGDSSLSISGGTVTLSALMNNASYPDLNGVLIDDQAPSKSKNAVTVNGGGQVELDGAMYFPNVDVSWGGTISSSNTTCAEVIANTLTITGSAYMSTQNCAPGTVAHTQVVTLVQ